MKFHKIKEADFLSAYISDVLSNSSILVNNVVPQLRVLADAKRHLAFVQESRGVGVRFIEIVAHDHGTLHVTPRLEPGPDSNDGILHTAVA